MCHDEIRSMNRLLSVFFFSQWKYRDLFGRSSREPKVGELCSIFIIAAQGERG